MTQNAKSVSDVSSKPIIFYVLSIPLLFYYYFGEFRVVTGIVYLAAILVFIHSLGIFGRIRSIQVYVVLAFVFLMVISLTTFTSIVPALLALRLNFGSLILILAFSFIRVPNINQFVVFLSIWTLGEFFLIRLEPSLIYTLPNYDDSFKSYQLDSIFGGVHSFGGNRTVTAVILLALYAFLEATQPKRKYRYLPLIACIFTASGTAYALLFIYLLIKHLRSAWIFILVAMVLGFILFYQNNDAALIEKFSWTYIAYLWDFKYQQILLYWDMTDTYGVIFGLGSKALLTASSEAAGYGSAFGDFIFLDFFARFGLLGLIILLIIPIVFARNQVRFPIWIMFIGTLHYHVLFSSAGQVVIAYLVIVGIKNTPLMAYWPKLLSKNSITVRC